MMIEEKKEKKQISLSNLSTLYENEKEEEEVDVLKLFEEKLKEAEENEKTNKEGDLNEIYNKFELKYNDRKRSKSISMLNNSQLGIEGLSPKLDAKIDNVTVKILIKKKNEKTPIGLSYKSESSLTLSDQFGYDSMSLLSNDSSNNFGSFGNKIKSQRVHSDFLPKLNKNEGNGLFNIRFFDKIRYRKIKKRRRGR
jgi:hypothetical protein